MALHDFWFIALAVLFVGLFSCSRVSTSASAC